MSKAATTASYRSRWWKPSANATGQFISNKLRQSLTEPGVAVLQAITIAEIAISQTTGDGPILFNATSSRWHVADVRTYRGAKPSAPASHRRHSKRSAQATREPWPNGAGGSAPSGLKSNGSASMRNSSAMWDFYLAYCEVGIAIGADRCQPDQTGSGAMTDVAVNSGLHGTNIARKVRHLVLSRACLVFPTASLRAYDPGQCGKGGPDDRGPRPFPCVAGYAPGRDSRRLQPCARYRQGTTGRPLRTMLLDRYADRGRAGTWRRKRFGNLLHAAPERSLAAAAMPRAFAGFI